MSPRKRLSFSMVFMLSATTELSSFTASSTTSLQTRGTSRQTAAGVTRSASRDLLACWETSSSPKWQWSSPSCPHGCIQMKMEGWSGRECTGAGVCEGHVAPHAPQRQDE